MADLKISQLTSATTPLAGTEVLPVVQSGTTKQVSIANLTAGRTQTSNGIVQGTAGTGYNFTANTPAAGKTSQLLNWYEEGTWTPTLSLGSGSVTYTSQTGRYTRIGRVVVFSAQIGVAIATTPGSTVEIGGLPFTPVTGSVGAVSILVSGATALATTAWGGNVESANPYIRLYTYAAGSLTNPGAYIQNGTQISVSGTYEV